MVTVRVTGGLEGVGFSSQDLPLRMVGFEVVTLLVKSHKNQI